jgi:hypothetical protein
MRLLLAIPLAFGLVALAGCGSTGPALAPEELAEKFETHKGKSIVLSGTPKIVIPEKKQALFYTKDGQHRISAEFTESIENLKAGQPCKLSGTVKSMEVKTIVLTKCKVLP